MTNIASSSVRLQISSHAVPLPPAWFGEVALLVHYLQQQGGLAVINA